MNQVKFGELDGNEVLMCSLVKENKDLVTQGNIFEMALENNEQGKRLNTAEQNVVKWYKSLENSYPGKSKATEDFVYKNGDKKIIQTIENNEYHGLKKALEVMLKDIFQAHLGDNANVFLTSDYDDIKSGIDAIIEIPSENGSEYLGVDFCVTKNQRYIESKGQKTLANPKEFSHHIGEDVVMRRIVKDFHPQVISIIFNAYLKKIIEGGNPNNNLKTVYTLAKNYIAEEKGIKAIETQISMKEVVEELLAA